MSVFLPSNVLAQFATNVEAVVNASPASGTFTRSAYRFSLEQEPASAPDGLYFLDLQNVLPHLRRWGDGSKITDSTIVVRMLYSRPGGALNDGDRQGVLRNAADDCDRLGDVCENPDNYGASTSGIRTVTFQGYRRAADLTLGEIWEVTFLCQWESDLDTGTVIDFTEANMIVDGINTGTIQLVAVSANSLSTGSQAFVRDPSIWRNYRLNKASVATPDNITVVAALGGGNWIAEIYEDPTDGSLEITVA